MNQSWLFKLDRLLSSKLRSLSFSVSLFLFHFDLSSIESSRFCCAGRVSVVARLSWGWVCVRACITGGHIRRRLAFGRSARFGSSDDDAQVGESQTRSTHCFLHRSSRWISVDCHQRPSESVCLSNRLSMRCETSETMNVLVTTRHEKRR